MLYSNVDNKTKELTINDYVIQLGEEGRGRKMLTLPAPAKTQIDKGENAGMTIGTTRSGRPRIIAGKDNALYLLLSAEGGYTRRGNGTIEVLKGHEQDVTVLARGNGADGAAGNVGYWDCMLLKVNVPNTEIIVRTSGGGYGIPSDLLRFRGLLYVIRNGKVEAVLGRDPWQWYDAVDEEMPFTYGATEENYGYNKEEWHIL